MEQENKTNIIMQDNKEGISETNEMFFKLSVDELLGCFLLKENDNLYFLVNDEGKKVTRFGIQYYQEDAYVSIVTEYEYRKKGYGTLGVKLLCNELFSGNIKNIRGTTVKNKVSESLACKIGFTIEKGDYQNSLLLKNPYYKGI